MPEEAALGEPAGYGADSFSDSVPAVRRLGAIVAALCILGLTGCGGQTNQLAAQQQRAQRALAKIMRNATPKERARLRRVQKQFGRILQQAEHPPRALPGYLVPASKARLHGLDLWNAIVDPMFSPLEHDLTTASLRSQLSAPQFNVYILFLIDDDYENGGLAAVYFNSSGTYATQAVAAMRAIDAPQHAAVMADANAILWPDGQIPISMVARRRYLHGVADPRFNPDNRRWDAADRSEGTLEHLVELYIRANRSAFFTRGTPVTSA